MFVRTASARDIEAVRALLVETWHDTYDAIYGPQRVTEITDEWHAIPVLESRLTQPHSEFLVADDGTRIGGMAFAAAADEGKTVVLHQLYVLPALQGRGIGGLLLDEVESCFPDAGTVRLDVVEANERAVLFYQAQGFAQVGEDERDGERHLILERPIVWAD